MNPSAGRAHLQRLSGGTGHFVVTPGGRSFELDGDEIRKYAKENLGMTEKDPPAPEQEILRGPTLPGTLSTAWNTAMVIVPRDSPLGKRVWACMESKKWNESQALHYLMEHDPVSERLWEEHRKSAIASEEIHRASMLDDVKRLWE